MLWEEEPGGIHASSRLSPLGPHALVLIVVSLTSMSLNRASAVTKHTNGELDAWSPRLKIRQATYSHNDGLTFYLLRGELQLKRHNANRAIRWYTQEKKRSSCIVNGSFHSRGSEHLGTTPVLASAMITVFQVDRVTVCICSYESALFICDLELDTHLLTVCSCAQLLASPLFIFILFWKAKIFAGSSEHWQSR